MQREERQQLDFLCHLFSLSLSVFLSLLPYTTQSSDGSAIVLIFTSPFSL